MSLDRIEVSMLSFLVKHPESTLKNQGGKVKMGKKKWFLLIIAVLTTSVMISVCGQALADPASDPPVSPNNSEESLMDEANSRFLEYEDTFFSKEFVEKYEYELIEIARAAGERTFYAYKYLPIDLMENYAQELVEIAKAAKENTDYVYACLSRYLMTNYPAEMVEIAKAAGKRTSSAYRDLPIGLMKNYAQELVEIAQATGEFTSYAYRSLRSLPINLMKAHSIDLVEIAGVAREGTFFAYNYIKWNNNELISLELAEKFKEIVLALLPSDGSYSYGYGYRLDDLWNSFPKRLVNDYIDELVEIAKAAKEKTPSAYLDLPQNLMKTYAAELVEIAKAAGKRTSSAYRDLPIGLMKNYAQELVEIAKVVGKGTPFVYRYIQWNNNRLISLEQAEKFKEIFLASPDNFYLWRHFPKDLVNDYLDELAEIAKATGIRTPSAYRYLPRVLMKTHAQELVEIAKAAGEGTPFVYRYIQWNNNRLISLEIAEKFREIVLALLPSDSSRSYEYGYDYRWYDLWEYFPKELVNDYIDELVEIAKAAKERTPWAYKYLPKDLMVTHAAELVEIAEVVGKGTSFVYRYIQWNNNQLISLELAKKFKEIISASLPSGRYRSYVLWDLWAFFPKELVNDYIDELVEIAKLAEEGTLTIYRYLPKDLMESNATELVEITKVAREGTVLAYRYIQWNNNELISLELAEKFREIVLASFPSENRYRQYHYIYEYSYEWPFGDQQRLRILWESLPKGLVNNHIDELVEIAKAVGRETPYTYENLPVDLMNSYTQELVEIAKTLKMETSLVYSFVKVSGALLTIQQAQEFVRLKKDPEGKYYSKSEYVNSQYKKFIEKLESPEIKGMAKYLTYDLRTFRSDFLRAKILILIEELAPEKVNLVARILQSAPYYYDYGRRTTHPAYEKIKQWMDTAEILIKLRPSGELNTQQREYLQSKISNTLFTLARTIDYLHDQVNLREKVASSFSPQICYFIIGGREEIYTSSFNLLFDNLAFRLTGGEGLLPQEREERSQAQNQRIDLGERKIIDYLEKIDPDRSYFFHFITKTSYYGRLYRIIPQGEENQKDFLRQILRLMETKGSLTRNIFYLSPTFEDIFTQERNAGQLRGVLEELLLETFTASKGINRKIYGLLILRYFQYFSESSREKAESVVERIKEECGIDQENLSSVPAEWLEPQADEERPIIKIKLYFENEGLAKKGQRPVHYGIFKALFTNRKLNTRRPGRAKIIGGYQVKELNDDEELLTKRIDDVEVRIILSVAKKRNITGDWQDPTIDIIAHRGHSYHVRNFFWISGRAKISWPKGVFLGSCGGFNDIPELDRTLNYQAQFIASKSEGRGIINNVIIYFLVEALAEGLRDWSEIKAYIFEKIEGNLVQIKKDISQNIAPCQARKFTLRRLRTYSFPADLPMLILRYAR